MSHWKPNYSTRSRETWFVNFTIDYRLLLQYSVTYVLLVGLVSHVVPVKELVPSALKIAEKISSHSKLIVRMCKECVNQAYELTLQQGLQVEKRGFHATFATVSFNIFF